jgi:hypothetical protein
MIATNHGHSGYIGVNQRLNGALMRIATFELTKIDIISKALNSVCKNRKLTCKQLVLSNKDIDLANRNGSCIHQI